VIDFSHAIDQIENMIDGFVTSLPNLALAILVFVVFYFLARPVKLSISRIVVRTGRQANLGIVLGRLAQWTIWLLGLLLGVVIVFPDISPAQLFELLGLGSVALGFAFRDILQNFFAGLLLLTTEPFKIGDQIIVDNFEGTVENIETRATTMRTYDGRRVVIPNTQMFTSPVTVNTAFERRRVEYDVGIGYGENIGEAKKVILEVVGRVEGVLQDPPPQVIVVGLGDFTVILRVRWWIKPSLRTEMIDSRDHVLGIIKQELEQRGIDMPFPTQQVLLYDQTRRES
jgi:small conductance mechanosensitive channel